MAPVSTKKKPVLAATYWPTNGHMIADLAKIGYLKKNLLTLDPTYGEGLWWTEWQPSEGKLFDHDLKIDGHDFRNLPYRDNYFGQITYDPPYVSVGGRDTSNIKVMYDAYGLRDAPTSPVKLQKLINEGLTEMYRLVRPARRLASGELSGGIVICKQMNYVSSGKLHLGIFHTMYHAWDLGFEIEAQLFHVRKSGGPQPQNRTKKLKNGKIVKSKQQHPHNNVSCALVLRKVS